MAVIGMKTQLRGKGWPDHTMGEGISQNQAALKWVLEDTNVDTAIPGVTSFEQLNEDIDVMGMKLAMDTGRGTRKYTHTGPESYCSGVAGCTGCEGQCPKGVCPWELNRCVGYADDYGDIGTAWENYRLLPVSTRADVCGDCDECVVNCVRGNDLTTAMHRARELFS